MTTFDASTATAMALGPDVMHGLYVAATVARPLEACGVLCGLYGADGVANVSGMAQLANVAIRPRHAYRFDEEQQAQTWDKVRGMGREVLGVWHTHPEGPDRPSETDLEYMQPWLLYPLLYLEDGGVWSMKVYRLGGDAVPEEVPINLSGSAPL